MTLRNLRAYTQNADDTLDGVDKTAYETGKGENARLRKINLNVDIATQDELNQVYNDLLAKINQGGAVLSNYYDKTEVDAISSTLSDQVTADIAAEATARENADNAITASLSAYALSTTVADAYKLSVSDAAEQTSSFVYTFKQGTEEVGTINVPKDMFVEGASFQGTVLVLSVRGQDTPISTDLSGLVDEYDGSENDDVKVTTTGNVVSVEIKDTIARVGDASTAVSGDSTIEGAKKYADEVAQAAAQQASHTHANKDALDTITSADIDAWNDAEQNAKDYADGKISSVVGDNTYLTATTDDHAVTVSATDKLTAVVNTVETSASVWDTVTNKADLTALTAEETARANADEFLSGKIDALSVSLNAAEGDAYVSAYVDGNTVKVEAQDKLTAVVDKVETSSAAWDAAEQNAKDYADGLSVNYDPINAAADVKTALLSGDGTTSSDNTILGVKAYADAIVADSSVTAEGDDIVSADADGKDITVGATEKLSTVVARVEGSAAAWNEVSAKIDTATVVNAANQLSVLEHMELSDYNDIDEIITEVEKIKGALINFTTALEA